MSADVASIVSLVKNAKRYESPGERLVGTVVIGIAEARPSVTTNRLTIDNANFKTRIILCFMTYRMPIGRSKVLSGSGRGSDIQAALGHDVPVGALCLICTGSPVMGESDHVGLGHQSMHDASRNGTS